MSDIITVEDLNLWYGSTQALHHVSMGIPEKSIGAYTIGSSLTVLALGYAAASLAVNVSTRSV